MTDEEYRRRMKKANPHLDPDDDILRDGQRARIGLHMFDHSSATTGTQPMNIQDALKKADHGTEVSIRTARGYIDSGSRGAIENGIAMLRSTRMSVVEDHGPFGKRQFTTDAETATYLGDYLDGLISDAETKLRQARV